MLRLQMLQKQVDNNSVQYNGTDLRLYLNFELFSVSNHQQPVQPFENLKILNLF